MNSWIRWCSCGREILKTIQRKENGGQDKCDLCLKEHAQTLAERLGIENNKDEFNS
jgi:hypothetical protein